MSDLIILPSPGAVTTPFAEPELTEAAADYMRASRAESTRASYAWHFASFCSWCQERGILIDLRVAPAPLEAVLFHLTWMAEKGMAAGTISGRVSALRYAHKLAGQSSPTTSPEVATMLAGINRTLGTAPRHRKEAATFNLILEMLAVLPRDTLIGLRDAALISLGFAAALRRSELVGLDVADLVEVPQGIRLTIRRSKTDQTGAGQEVAVPSGHSIKPYERVRRWLDAAGITDGPIFRPVRVGGHVRDVRLSDASAAEVVKQAARRAGLDARVFAGHSLRAGFCTSAVDAGADVFSIIRVTRHKTTDMLATYVRRRDDFKQHPGASFL